MTISMFEVVALIFQRVERFIFHLPSGSSASHEANDIAPADPQVGHPTQVLDFVSPHVPVLDEIDPHRRMRRIEGHVIDEAKPMDNQQFPPLTL